MDSTFAFAYCQIAKADDWLYLLNLDDSPKRRTHGDAAVNEALRLKPNLPETHLAAASHLYTCYRDYQGARVHIAIAERALPNSADALALGGYLDRRQGRWAESTKALERACNLDPKNAEILRQLLITYALINQYRDQERSLDRLVALEPENSRDWTKARELVRSSSNEELPFGGERGSMVPRICLAFRALDISVRTPASGITYGELRLGPDLDPVRADPRFDKLLAQLAPHE